MPVITEADARDIYRSRRILECGPDALRPLPDPKPIAAIHRAFAAAVAVADWPRAFEIDVDFHVALLAAAGLEGNERAEDLPVEAFLAMARALPGLRHSAWELRRARARLRCG